MVTVLKSILGYLFWSILSFVCTFIYAKLLLGARPTDSKGFMRIFDFLYDFALLQITTYLGAALAIIFVAIDLFYLRKQRKHQPHKLAIRFGTFIAVFAVIIATHLFLEKGIDVI